MNRFFLYLFSIVGAGLLVQGCAPLAPGFSSASGDAKQAVSPSGFAPPNVDPPPPGALTPITPELIQAGRGARPSTLPADVQALLGEPEVYKIGNGEMAANSLWQLASILLDTNPGTSAAIRE